MDPNFKNLPILFKSLIIIGFITTIVFIVLLVVIISLMSESKLKPETDVNLDDFDDFLREFKNGDSKDKFIEIDYPDLPRIKDLRGNLLLNLLQIDLI